MKRRALEGCFLVVTIVILALILFPIFTKHRGDRSHSCMSNLRQIMLGISMYCQDYDNKLPSAIFPGKTAGWANGLQPYLLSTQIFQCPSESNFPSDTPPPNQPGFTDYWMNRNISGIESKKIAFPEEIIIMGDGDGDSPQSTASYAINHLPASWLQSSNSPAKRHLDGANYAFVDGHVKWLKPDQVTQEKPEKNKDIYTFGVK